MTYEQSIAAVISKHSDIGSTADLTAALADVQKVLRKNYRDTADVNVDDPAIHELRVFETNLAQSWASKLLTAIGRYHGVTLVRRNQGRHKFEYDLYGRDSCVMTLMQVWPFVLKNITLLAGAVDDETKSRNQKQRIVANELIERFQHTVSERTKRKDRKIEGDASALVPVDTIKALIAHNVAA